MLRRIINIRHLTTCAKTNSQNVVDAVNKSSILINEIDKEDENEYEEMFVKTPFDNIEWGGPLRGGRMPEPTRFGDWERKGRCTDY